ncbi:MAG: hypothetical protein UV01_C0019G0003 [Parcubacteria group bacterium GW2011_GWA2_42_14]|nr:MAG: hypothetical protein UV01_C0019G0003 [Parcubacteria group bacterium GW2011_GWA2_42_14]OGZ97858.1 MAG: hypothetical protein A3D41_03020 [Candidatus Sungbacteria bacterium RIFCSPHIGHO2_02_FULL_41_12b]
MTFEKAQKNNESKELNMAAKHNIEEAISDVSRKNNCSYEEAVMAVKNFVDFLNELSDKAIKTPDWNEKSDPVPYNYDEHKIFEIGEGKDKKKIKMSGETNITYAARVLKSMNQSTLKDAFDEVKRWTDFLSEEHEKNKIKKR